MSEGTVIFKEGESGACAYVIERGAVEISTQRGSEKVVIARRVAGEIFGEMAIVDNQPRSATVTAIEESELRILTAQQLQDRMANLDPVLRMVLSIILDRFRDTMQRLKGEANLPVLPSYVGTPLPESRLRHHQEAIERIELEQSLRRAIEREELLLYFQPIVSCRSGHIHSLEALIRWQHPERGLLQPGAFIDAAEQSGLITDITYYVIDKACQGLVAIREGRAATQRPEDNPKVSVNISAREFADSDFVDRIEDTLRKHRVDPTWLTLEITESLLMKNADTSLEILERCQGIGLTISIDDFGTGYSSLSYLHRYPFETLKIDRSFMAGLQGEGNGQEIVRAMIALGHGLGMQVVAEGIEEPEQAAAVQGFGCDYWQGYLFSRPVALNGAVAMVRDWKGLDEAPLKRATEAGHNSLRAIA